jgi:pimeloyl-ACP methyl ester carboxylesterase
MIPMTDIAYERLDLHVNGVSLEIATARRGGEAAPIVFLHGFGSMKEDYVDLAYHPGFRERPFLAYDAPGCGESSCEDLSKLSIPFLVDTAKAVLRKAGIERFHLVGHSMGGLTALLLAHQDPDRVLSFVDIEGNVAPEDCFLSRQVITHAADDAESFFDAFIERTRHSPFFSSALYAASLRHKVRPGAVRGIFESMVDLSDTGDLMTKFLSLSCPRMFMYGEQNASLPTCPHSPPAASNSPRSHTAGTSRCIPTPSRCGRASPTSTRSRPCENRALWASSPKPGAVLARSEAVADRAGGLPELVMVGAPELPGMRPVASDSERRGSPFGGRPAARFRQAPGDAGRAGRSRLAVGPNAFRAHQIAAARR